MVYLRENASPHPTTPLPKSTNLTFFVIYYALLIKENLALTSALLDPCDCSPTSPKCQALYYKWRFNLTPLAVKLEFKFRIPSLAFHSLWIHYAFIRGSLRDFLQLLKIWRCSKFVPQHRCLSQGSTRSRWNLIKNKSRTSPDQIGSTSWIFVNIWMCLWGESYFSNVRGALLTKMPRGRWISICDFKGCVYLFVFALSLWFWASLL